jgi:hypothetical protein
MRATHDKQFAERKTAFAVSLGFTANAPFSVVVAPQQSNQFS